MLDILNPKQGRYIGLANEKYQRADAISNSALQLIARNPSDYLWSKVAPKDYSKSGAIDVGTAIHAAILEPEKTDSFLVGPTKGRDTIKFADFCQANPDKTVLTQSEYDLVRFSVDSVMAHPTASLYLTNPCDCEVSIFYDDLDRGIKRKIRPDKEVEIDSGILLLDVKKTKSIADWREPLKWKNPLFTLGYGHNAAYYMDTASKFYGEQINEYRFLLLQSTIELGMYPVSVFCITRQELEMYGFFDEMNANLDIYAERKKTGDWFSLESFPQFPIDESEEVTFTYEGE